MERGAVHGFYGGLLPGLADQQLEAINRSLVRVVSTKE